MSHFLPFSQNSNDDSGGSARQDSGIVIALRLGNSFNFLGPSLSILF